MSPTSRPKYLYSFHLIHNYFKSLVSFPLHTLKQNIKENVNIRLYNISYSTKDLSGFLLTHYPLPSSNHGG